MGVHPIASDLGYSPPLRIELEFHGHRLDVAELGPEFLRVRGTIAVAPGAGTVRVDVEGQLTAFDVELVDGIDPQRKRQPCRSRGPVAHQAGRPLAAAG